MACYGDSLGSIAAVYSALCSSEYMTLKYGLTSDKMNRRCAEGKRLGVIRALTHHISGRTEERHKKSSFMIVSSSVAMHHNTFYDFQYTMDLLGS
jgi:hypothetical protein